MYLHTGKVALFDMCTCREMTLNELAVMFTQLGLVLGSYDVWFLLGGNTLCENSLIPIKNDVDVAVMLDQIIYGNLFVLYTTEKDYHDYGSWYDFSFTQFQEDERIERIDGIRIESKNVNVDDITEEPLEDGEDVLSFHGDSLNLDSSDSDIPQPKSKAMRVTSQTNVARKIEKKKKGKLFEKSINAENVSNAEKFVNNEAGIEADVEVEKYVEFEESDSSEGTYDSSDERMTISSCDEEEIRYPEFNEITGMDDPQFSLGMLFSSGVVFRTAVQKYAIVNQKGIGIKKNLKDKIKWVCQDGCPRKCYGVKQQRTTNIQIKTLCLQHTCNPCWEQKQVNSTWIAKFYEDEIRMNPSWPAQAFQSRVVNDLKCNISQTMIYRALRKAKEQIIGKHEDEFKKLYSYTNEIKKVMPSSTIKLMTQPAERD